MTNKAFTLVELLATIVIIGIVALIVIPSITDSLENSRKRAYDTQINELKSLAKKWATDNTDKLDEYHLNNTYITFSLLKEEGYMRAEIINNPIDEEQMVGCIEIKYNNETSSYDYNYIEQEYNGEDYTTAVEQACDQENGYIYTYKDGNLVSDKTKTADIAYNLIYQKNEDNIKVVGQSDNGLYDIEDEYIFKGSDVANYVYFGDSEDAWRIISMNKKDKTIRLIRENLIATNSWDSNGIIEFENAAISSEQLDTYYNNTASSLANVLEKINNKTIFYVGTVDTIDSYDIVKSKEVSKEVNSKIGIINISDYLGASTTCDTFDKSSCSSNNYLFDMISGSSSWTINNNGTQIWSINSEGDIVLTNADSLYSIYPVIELNPNVMITGGEGTEGNPYIIN